MKDRIERMLKQIGLLIRLGDISIDRNFRLEEESSDQEKYKGLVALLDAKYITSFRQEEIDGKTIYEGTFSQRGIELYNELKKDQMMLKQYTLNYFRRHLN